MLSKIFREGKQKGGRWSRGNLKKEGLGMEGCGSGEFIASEGIKHSDRGELKGDGE